MPKTVTTVETKSSKSPQSPPAITYRLSEKFFLDLGWTSKPKISSVHTMVTMRAKFSHPVLSPWFKVEEKDATRYYRNGRTLCLVRKDGTGQIYYPNGTLAINIEKGTVNRHRTRLWVYSLERVEPDGMKHPSQLCALFDSLGNGVVYDDCMNKRLVYNQREGVLWDSPTGIPINWQWHNIPYPESLSVENEDDDDKSSVTEVTKLSRKSPPTESKVLEEKENCKSGQTESPAKLTHSEHAFLKNLEKWRFLDTEKLIPRTVSFIKPIALQINRYISLTILSQSDISLKFFGKGQHTQLKIGVLYNPYEVLQVTEVDDESFMKDRVLCSFESFPARSQSMMRFKELIHNGRMAACHLYSKSHP